MLCYTQEEKPKITFQFNFDEMIRTDDFNFSANGSKTIMIQNCSVNSKAYLTACVFPYYKWKFTSASQEYMDRFKKLIENNED